MKAAGGAPAGRSEAGRALLGLLPVLGHHRLVADCFRDNPASARVLRKLGFHPTGQMALRTAPARDEPAPAASFAIDLQLGDGGISGGDSEGNVAEMVALRAA